MKTDALHFCRKIDFILLFVSIFSGLLLGGIYFFLAFTIMNNKACFTILCWDFSFESLKTAVFVFCNLFPSNSFYQIGIWFILGLLTSFSLWLGYEQSIYILNMNIDNMKKLTDIKNSCNFASHFWLTFATLAALILLNGIFRGPY